MKAPAPNQKPACLAKLARNALSAENTHQNRAILIANEMRSPANATNSQHATYDFLIANEFHTQNALSRAKSPHQKLPHKSDVVYPETRKGTEFQIEICLQSIRRGS